MRFRQAHDGGGCGLSPAGWTQLPNVLLTDERTAAALDKLSGKQLRIFLAVLAHRNAKTGACYPSMRKIAETCHFSLRTVERAVPRFRALGLITTTRGQSLSYCFPHVDLWEQLNAVIVRHKRGGISSNTTRHNSGGSSSPTTRHTGSDNPPLTGATTRHKPGGQTTEQQTEQNGEPLRSPTGSRLAQYRQEDATTDRPDLGTIRKLAADAGFSADADPASDNGLAGRVAPRGAEAHVREGGREGVSE